MMKDEDDHHPQPFRMKRWTKIHPWGPARTEPFAELAEGGHVSLLGLAQSGYPTERDV